jgi:excisionase family DNA binding protein
MDKQKGNPMTTNAIKTPSPIDSLLAIKDAAATIGVCRASLYPIMASGRLSAVKVGARTMIRRSELERFLASLPKAKFGEAAQEAAGARAA